MRVGDNWAVRCGATLAMALIPALLAAAEPAAPAVFISAGQFGDGLKNAPAGQAEFDQALATAMAGELKISVDVNRRTRAEQRSLLHERVTEIYRILSGGGTLQTGGTLVDSKRMEVPAGRAIGPTLEGTSISGGQSRHVTAGDVVVIPPGTPHLFTQLDGAIVYEVIRIDPAPR